MAHAECEMPNGRPNARPRGTIGTLAVCLACCALPLATALFVDAAEPGPPAAAGPSAPAGEKLLLDFEPGELDKLARPLSFEKKEEKTKEGVPVVVYRQKDYRALALYVYPGRGASGSHALGLGLQKKDPGPGYYHYGEQVQAPPDALEYYGIFQNNYGAEGGSLVNICGPFRRMFPTDWSGYDLLRFEAFARDRDQTVRVSLEDEEVAPPVIRNIAVPAGRWTTVEVDLRAAARERGLDPKRMATLAMTVVDAKGELKPAHSMFVDDLRLSLKTAPARHPVARDDSPHTLPDYFRHVTRPTAETLPDAPDRTPLGPQKPFVIPTEQPCALMPVGWAAAYDNRRLLVGFSRANEVHVLQSLDAGASWRGLEGAGTRPTVVPVPYFDHQCGRGDVAGQRADVFLFTNLGCRGPVPSALRLFTRRITFTPNGWVQQPKHTLVDCDLRHCNSNQSVARAADGRLWAAYGIYGRLGTLCINVRYSDDNGVTWKSSKEGTSGVIPGTIRSNTDGWGFGYTVEEPCVVPLGGGAACLWQEREGYNFKGLKWARFDGKAWGRVEDVPEPKRTVYNPTRPPVLAVGLGGKEVFAVSALGPGVLHYADGKWTIEAPEIPAGGRISVAGDRTVVVVAAACEGPKKGPVVLNCWQRSPDGEWTGPVELAREEAPLASIEPTYEIRVGYVTQPYAPANFVPLAWSCEGQKWIKYLRVPVPIRP